MRIISFIMSITRFADVIELWETAEILALDVGETGVNVRAWKHRNNIPPLYWVRLVGAARQRGYDGVTYELLARLSAARGELKKAA